MQQKSKLIVVGGGGFSREVIWLAESMGNFEIVGLLDDSDEMRGKNVADYPVLGKLEEVTSYRDSEIIVAIGSPRVRKTVVNRILELLPSVHFATLIHHSVIRSNCLDIGAGSILAAGCIFTVDIEIGQHVILNLNVTVGHDCKIGNFCTIAPMCAISGNVTMEDFVEIGTGSAIKQAVILGKGSMVGMGGIVTKNIEPFSLVFGTPAKKVKQLPEVS